MPKNKTHSGAKKRFRVTGSGKLMREQANKRHLLEVKSDQRRRREEARAARRAEKHAGRTPKGAKVAAGGEPTGENA